MHIRLIIASVIMVLGLVSVTPSAMAATSAPASGGALVVQGAVLGTAGQAVVGQQVNLIAWPQQQVTAALQPGQAVPTTLVGSAVTSASGSYAIPVASAGGLAASADDGTVNLEVITTGTAGFSAFSFHRQLVATAAGAAFAASPAGATQTANLRLLPGGQPASAAPGVQCGILHFVRSFGDRQTTVGGVWSHVTGVSVTFTYTVGQHSSLGVGVKGVVGGWSGSGTYSIEGGVSSSTGFPKVSGVQGTHFRTNFVYGLYAVECGGQQAQPTSYAGGTRNVHSATPSATHCVLFRAGSTFTLSRSSAYTYSGGVEMSGPIGIDLSAHTGYNTGAALAFTFTQNRHLCGTNANPGAVPKRIVAGLG
jgi:hypothetical protein